jgi:signal peptidase II
VRNTGAAFGILPNNNVFFIGLTLTILLVLAFLHRRLAAQGRWSAWGIAFLWGGALGNLADRVFHGSVTDFLAFFWRQWHWPTFNVADSAICIGISLLFLESFRCSPSEKTADPPPFIGTL